MRLELSAPPHHLGVSVNAAPFSPSYFQAFDATVVENSAKMHPNTLHDKHSLFLPAV